MSNTCIVLDTPHGIEFFRLATLRGALRLEQLGMRRRGTSALTLARVATGLKTRDRGAQIEALTAILEQMLEEKHAQDTQV